jgi:pimeloyl-ACP methyl ester carboxylesterase
MVRIVLTMPLGLAAAAAGLSRHAARIVAGTPEPVDYTGALLGLAGIALVGLAFHEALRGRGRSAKLLAIPAVLVLAQWFLLPVVTAGLVTNAHHHHVAGAASLGLPGARDVSFPAADGTPLAGWYVPGRRTSAVILLHGSHGTRADTLAHLRMLSAAGFGVLAFDARGHGQSEGRPNALGWRGSNDLAGAFDFVRRQPGVNPEGIAALGLSMGAEEALRAAAEGVPVEAVVADGAGASTTGDQQLVDGSPVATSVNWLTMRAVEALSGDSEPTPLKSVVGRVFVPTLLIASGAPGERTMAEHLRRRMHGDAAVWYVSDAGHTKALNAHPAAYRDSVVRFLDQASSRRLSSSW